MKSGLKSNLSGLTSRMWDVGPPPTPRDALGWFEEAWPRKDRYPDLGACAYVAQGVRVIRDVEEGRRVRRRNLSEEKAVAAVKTGAGVFLKHAPSVLRQLEANIERLTLQVTDSQGSSTLITDEKWHGSVSETRDKVNRARDAMSGALEALKSWSAPYGEADHLLWVKRYMQQAWEWTDGSRPQSTNDDGPVVLFIQAALASVGDNRKPEAIGRALRRLRSKTPSNDGGSRLGRRKRTQPSQ